MKYTSALIAVSDMSQSRSFYCDVLGLAVEADFGANVTLTGGIALQTLDSWKTFIKTDKVSFGANDGELYFEEDDIERFCVHLKDFEIEYVHPLFEHRWGQRVVRFYDPDRHIIEVGEKLSAVVKRFAVEGLNGEAIAERMDVPLDFVVNCLKENN